MPRKKALILTFDAGQGHMSAAKAFDYWMSEWGYNTQLLNIMSSVQDDIYKILVKYPSAWRSLFEISNNTLLSSPYIKSITKLVDLRIKGLVPGFDNFDFVISTHPFIHSQIGKNRIILLLDVSVHQMYLVKPYLDYYFAYWQDSLKEIKNRSESSKKILYIGPLLRSAFYDVGSKINSEDDKKLFKEKLNLDPKTKLVLVVAGGGWIDRSEKYINSIVERFSDQKIMFAFVCGRNIKFYKKALKKYQSPKEKKILKFLSWLNESQMAEWMGAADFALAFSVAQTFSEGCLCATPFIIFDYIYGQEAGYIKIVKEKNISFFIEGGRKEKLDRLYEIITDDPHKTGLLKIKQNQQKWQKELLAVPNRYKEIFEKMST